MSTPDLIVECAFEANPLDPVSAVVTLPGAGNSFVTTPDSATIDITGDRELVARVAATDWTPAAAQTIASKWNTTGNQRSWRWFINTAGTIGYQWSADGTAVLTATSTVVTSFTDTVTYWLRVTHDVNNGAAGNTVQFWYAPDQPNEPIEWTQLGASVITAGVTSVFAGSAVLYVGGEPAGSLLVGSMRRFVMRNAISNGTVVAHCDPYDAANDFATSWGSTQVTDQVWTRGSATTLTILPKWTDLTARVRNAGVQMQRGKQNELQIFGTGSASITFDNRDRALDPDYATSPYAPNVQPRKRIRLRALWQNARYDLWTGYIESWPQQYATGNVDATTTVTAYDIMSVLGEITLEDAAHAYATTVIGGATGVFRAMVNSEWQNEGSAGGVLRRRRGIAQTEASPATGPGTAIVLNGTTYYSTGALDVDNQTPPRAGGGVNYSGGWSFWFKTTGAGPSATNWSLIIGSGATNAGGSYTQVRIGIDNAGKLNWAGSTPGWVGLAGAGRSLFAVNDGNWHHAVVVNDFTASVQRIYIDGQDVTDTSTGNVGDQPGFGVQVVGAPCVGNPSDTYFTGSIANLYCFNAVAITATQVRTWYQLARGAFVESTTARANRILDIVGMPASLEDLTQRPKGLVSDINTFEQSALQQLQLVADSEQGRLFADKSGRVRMDDRYWWQTDMRGLTVQATFSDDGADVPYGQVSSNRTLREVQNAVTVTGSNGTRVTVQDSSSITSYGRRSGSVSTLLASEAEVADMATGLLALRKQPQTRTDAIVVRPVVSATTWPDVLRRDIGDRVTFELMPMRPVAVTSQFTRTLIIERIDMQLAVGNWQIAITGSPIPGYTLFRFGTSLLGGSDVLGY